MNSENEEVINRLNQIKEKVIRGELTQQVQVSWSFKTTHGWSEEHQKETVSFGAPENVKVETIMAPSLFDVEFLDRQIKYYSEKK